MTPEHPLWLGEHTVRALPYGTFTITGQGPVIDSVRQEALRAGLAESDESADVSFRVSEDLPAEGFRLERREDRASIEYSTPNGALYGWFALVRDAVLAAPYGVREEAPDHSIRMLDHWDNIDVHPRMGQVERGYAGGSLFYEAGEIREDLSRIDRYGRALAAIGINAIAINNVNVHAREARLLTDDLHHVARIAALLRPWGIRTHLSVNWSSPMLLGGLDTSDPLDEGVAQWWEGAVDNVYETIPDFGGFLIKADSEGQPGPFAYGRDHADGANMLARPLAKHGGILHWRAFVYNHRQDWRDRKTDRARAAYDTFVPLDGKFDDNVIVQVKNGPLDFQVREPISPTIAAMKHTPIALELQVTQEYLGQQKHAVYLGEQWEEILSFRPHGEDGPRLAETFRGGMAAVSNVGDDPFWTGHPLAQANLYAYGRFTWNSALTAREILDEWIALTFEDPAAHDEIRALMLGSWRTYEDYTAPLGVCFMVNPNGHYGPNVDGYEYSPWGTYHFADRDGIGVDRTVATGTGYAGQYDEPWASTYESLDTVPDELILFFHHVPYTHVLHSGKTVIQHIYDTHFEGAEKAVALAQAWERLEGRIPADTYARGVELFAEQVRSAHDWRDQINTYFQRKSGITDEHGRLIYQ